MRVTPLNVCWGMQDLINMFNDHELELLISGLPEIDVDDLRGNTEYTGYTPAAKQIQWFWEIVAALSKEDLALLVQFVTGTSKVPLEGFKALQVSQAAGSECSTSNLCGLHSLKHPGRHIVSRHQITQTLKSGDLLSTACTIQRTSNYLSLLLPCRGLTLLCDPTFGSGS